MCLDLQWQDFSACFLRVALPQTMLELLQHLEHSHRVIDFSLLILILRTMAWYNPGLRLSSLERDPSSLLRC